jgi:hypothetical protein
MRTFKFPLEIDDNGLIIVLEDLDALRQKLEQRLYLFYRAWFLNTTRGVKYIEEIMRKGVSEGLAASILNNEVLKESEVTRIDNVTTSLSADRKFSYEATLQTIYGPTEISV